VLGEIHVSRRAKTSMRCASSKSAIVKVISERRGVKSTHIEGRDARNMPRIRLNICRQYKKKRKCY